MRLAPLAVLSVLLITISAPAAELVTDSILRSSRPARADLEEAKSEGFLTIVNLENERMAVALENELATELGMTYLSVPMSWLFRPKDEKVNAVLAHLARASEEPVLLHCKHGEDRTGMMIGLYRVFIQGWTPQDAYREMLDKGFHPFLYALDSYFKEKTGYPPDEPEYPVP